MGSPTPAFPYACGVEGAGMTPLPNHELESGQRARASSSSAFARRVVAGVVGGIYAYLCLLTYAELSNIYEYLGFWYRPAEPFVTARCIILAALLGVFLPTGNWNVTGFTKWILYFLLMIPALVIPPQQGAIPQEQLNLLFNLLWISSFAFIVFLRDGKQVRPINIEFREIIQVILAIYVIGHAYVAFVFRGSMNIVGIEEVYSQRTFAGDAASAAVVYVMGLLGNVINPYLLITGIMKKRYSFIALAISGQFLIYSTLAGKVVLASTLLAVLVLLVTKNGRTLFHRFYAALLAVGFLGPQIAYLAVYFGGVARTIASLIYFRVLLLPGVLVGVYTEFFLSNPLTYLSHSIVGRLFIEYPYGDESVGQVIGRYVTPAVDADLNNYIGTFVAGDGIAGFGIWGVPIAFALAALWLWFMSKLIGSQNRAFTFAMLAGYVVSLANTSLFTSILTGGGAALALLLYLHRSAEDTEARRLDRGKILAGKSSNSRNERAA